MRPGAPDDRQLEEFEEMRVNDVALGLLVRHEKLHRHRDQRRIRHPVAEGAK
jgi:hypothetical protein